MSAQADNPEDLPETGPSKDQWKAVRSLLKTGLLADEIPIDGKTMKPKEVWTKYKAANHDDMQCVDYENKSVREKFTRMLRSLRKKHKNGDLENEGQKAIEWGKSAAKQFLKKCFKEGTIPTDYQDAKQVWKDHCEGTTAFKRMQYDSAFVRRLGTVRDDYLKKLERCKANLQAFEIAKRNHPTPELNSRGEPQWNGSPAQRLLKELVKNNGHVNVKPAELWESREEYQVYSLTTFRDHIYQEERLLKFRNYTASLKKRKFDELQY